MWIDSDDETPERIRALRSVDLPVVLMHRPTGQRRGGLSGAVVEGFSAALGEILVVMDGDLQHPPEVLPSLAVASSRATFHRSGITLCGKRTSEWTSGTGPPDRVAFVPRSCADALPVYPDGPRSFGRTLCHA